MTLTPEQCRAGRALVGLSQAELADASHLGVSTVRDFEAGRRVPSPNNVLGIRVALEGRGVIFLDAHGNEGPGVRLRLQDDLALGD